MPKPTALIDTQLKQWATPTQAKYIDAVNEAGSMREAARKLGVTKSAVQGSMALLKIKAATKGYSPEHDMTHIAPDPFITKGVSTYFDKDGKPRGQWVKTQIDGDRLEEARHAARAALSEDLPRVASVPAPALTVDHLCNVYTITDYHIGMMAWKREGGADWDLQIAERTLIAAFEHMVMASPPARVGLVNQLGDFLHSDGMLPVTPTSGHVLDQDGRFAQIVAVAIRVLRRLVEFALTRHELVVVLMGEGNHDLASSIWVRALFRAIYENEPRVHVIDSELPYYVHQHGATMLAFHHGHLKKNNDLPLLFAAQFARIWGATTKRYCHVGHRHHGEEKEHSGMSVVQHPTLAARDAYAARGGWLSERQVTSMTYHSEYGQVARNTVTPEMLTI